MELLTPTQMSRADALAAVAGVPGTVLMERAGAAVAWAILRRWQPCRVLVVCGAGNNGGDGLVAARLLRERGWTVQVAASVAPGAWRGDAALACDAWLRSGGTVVQEWETVDWSACDLVVDALLGAGLDRPLQGRLLEWVETIHRKGLPVCAVDVPSGVDGVTGAVRGAAVQADLTVTFFRKKPGHLLYPGRGLCGTLELVDIGIPVHCLSELGIDTWENLPQAWALPHTNQPADAQAHKYHKGFVLVWGGATLPGAAMLAAQAAQKVGAGLVTIASPVQAHTIYAHAMQSIMVRPVASAQDFACLLGDAKRRVCVIGPGAGLETATREAVLLALQAAQSLVLDADALTVFQDDPNLLFSHIHAHQAAGAAPGVVLTPHEGEFARLFPHLDGDRLSRARAAARLSGAVVLLKGADTVVVAPDGRAFVNACAPASLASAGTGDVLAGLVAGLLAQGIAALDAAAMAVWLHSQAAQVVGVGLIAEDLLHGLPVVLQRLAAGGGGSGRQ
ncbi:NAD(P)H-hydrate epimerase [Lampropedia hyalina DSM 16112]|uniref:Bifunctional NAD(P)H-hydrate repair enzyme n=1 Tax=Lampropedia hyalina DSM 16112 TaxID=1122156 RepID=A0A1M4ZQ68_9BURK|nr:bifunctional ADP-dependent NAD(P)H-hydrate dehydratase/NAD(P)H-hydrate epimerase [Lampropedia hyalina]SHF19942.1 NAD(P)H-hydrate epimerase [Lampropedia hyalina DSM 16112]